MPAWRKRGLTPASQGPFHLRPGESSPDPAAHAASRWSRLPSVRSAASMRSILVVWLRLVRRFTSCRVAPVGSAVIPPVGVCVSIKNRGKARLKNATGYGFLMAPAQPVAFGSGPRRGERAHLLKMAQESLGFSLGERYCREAHPFPIRSSRFEAGAHAASRWSRLPNALSAASMRSILVACLRFVRRFTSWRVAPMRRASSAGRTF